jgi:DNA-binding protein HU-beta
MNKADLVDAVAGRAGLSKAEAQRALDCTFEAIAKALNKGDRVAVAGFGTFSVRKRAARVGRNPKTGAQIRIAAARMAAFKAGKALKDSVN